MLRDRYAHDTFFMGIQPLASEMDADLAQLDQVLADDAMLGRVKGDMVRRRGHTQHMGRPSSPVEVVLWMLVVKHLYIWSYEQPEHQVKDSLVLRRLCRIYFEDVPDDTTLIRWAGVIQPETLEALTERVLELARTRKLTNRRKLGTDGTVVETHIHYPTDSSLLNDGVRVLSRLLNQVKATLSAGRVLARTVLRDRMRSAQCVAQPIARQARRGTQALQGLYRHLVETAQASTQQAARVLTVLQQRTAQALCKQLECYLPRVQQVIRQTMRRVEGETLPPQLKLVSLFEPHTAILQRGKAGHETEFGRNVWLSEVEGGFISQHRIREGNPSDEAQWQPSLDHHHHLFGHPPRLTSADRGLSSPHNEAYAQQQAVKRVILPQRGAKDEARRRFEQQAWFRRGQAGIEGRIASVSSNASRALTAASIMAKRASPAGLVGGLRP